MTVSGRIIEWLKKFDPKEMKHIDTDLMRGTVDYVLVKEPTVNVRSIRNIIRSGRGWIHRLILIARKMEHGWKH